MDQWWRVSTRLQGRKDAKGRAERRVVGRGAPLNLVVVPLQIFCYSDTTSTVTAKALLARDQKAPGPPRNPRLPKPRRCPLFLDPFSFSSCSGVRMASKDSLKLRRFAWI